MAIFRSRRSRPVPASHVPSISDEDVRWSRTDVQRVLYVICTEYLARINSPLGVDDELMRSKIMMGVQTLKENNWWPTHQE